MELSASEAAKAVGISKQSIIRAIHRGKVSAVRNPSGEFVIDPSELFRVYQPASTTVTNKTEGDVTVTPNQTEVLHAKVELLERLLRDRDETITDLRQRLDQSQAEIAQLTAIVATLTPQPEPKRVNWWQRLLR